MIEVYQVANVPSGRAWGEVLRRVNAYTDLILIHLLETYRAMDMGHGAGSPEARPQKAVKA